VDIHGRGVGGWHKQDIHFCRIGDTILSIEELHQVKNCRAFETKNLQFVDFAFQMICIYLYAIQSGRPWTGGGVFQTDEVGHRGGVKMSVFGQTSLMNHP